MVVVGVWVVERDGRGGCAVRPRKGERILERERERELVMVAP